MKDDLFVKNGITIPNHEIEITASRAGGPGGQHVNKSNTRITIRWNVKNSTALSDEQKERLLEQLKSQITTDGYLIVHNNESRSQLQNKKLALLHLASKIRNGLYVPKKRMKTKIPKTIKEAILNEKTHRSKIKTIRKKKIEYE